MSTQINVPAPGQTGIPFAELAPPKFANYQFEGSTFRAEPGANVGQFEDDLARTGTHGFADTHLVLTGNIKIRVGSPALRLGDSVLAKDTAPSTWEGRWFTVMAAPAARAIQGHPAMQEITLRYDPAIQEYYQTSAPTDADAEGS